VRDKALRFVHRMKLAASGEVAALTMLTAVHLDTERRKATTLPVDIRSRAEASVGALDLPWDAAR